MLFNLTEIGEAEDLLLEFTVNPEFTDKFTNFLVDRVHKGIYNKKMAIMIIELIKKGYVNIGYDKNLILRIFRALIKSTKLMINSTFGTNLSYSSTLGYYSFRDAKVYIVLDDKKINEENEFFLFNEIIVTIEHELIHMAHVKDFVTAEKIMYPVANEFYSLLVKRFNLWLGITVNPYIMADILSEFTNRFVYEITINHKGFRSFNDIKPLFGDINKYKTRLKKGDDISVYEDWIEFVYTKIFSNDRLLNTDPFRYSFITSYSNIFRPGKYILNDIQQIRFYQELLTKSEIFALMSPGLVIKSELGRHRDVLIKLVKLI